MAVPSDAGAGAATPVRGARGFCRGPPPPHLPPPCASQHQTRSNSSSEGDGRRHSSRIPVGGVSTPPAKRRYVGGAPVGRSDVGRPSGHSAERQPMGCNGIHGAPSTGAGEGRVRLAATRGGATRGDSRRTSALARGRQQHCQGRQHSFSGVFPTCRHHFGQSVLTQASRTAAAATPVHRPRSATEAANRRTAWAVLVDLWSCGGAGARGGGAGRGAVFHLRGLRRGKSGRAGGSDHVAVSAGGGAAPRVGDGHRGNGVWWQVTSRRRGVALCGFCEERWAGRRTGRAARRSPSRRGASHVQKGGSRVGSLPPGATSPAGEQPIGQDSWPRRRCCPLGLPLCVRRRNFGRVSRRGGSTGGRRGGPAGGGLVAGSREQKKGTAAASR